MRQFLAMGVALAEEVLRLSELGEYKAIFTLGGAESEDQYHKAYLKLCPPDTLLCAPLSEMFIYVKQGGKHSIVNANFAAT